MTGNNLRIASPSTTIWGRVQHRQELAENLVESLEGYRSKHWRIHDGWSWGGDTRYDDEVSAEFTNGDDDNALYDKTSECMDDQQVRFFKYGRANESDINTFDNLDRYEYED